MLVDSHCHLIKEYYSNIDEIIKNAESKSVNTFFNIGTNTTENKEIISLIKKYPNMYGAIGIHPNQTKAATTSDLNFIVQNLKNKKIIAIGEIGLDYHYPDTNQVKQKKFFKRQLDLASKYNIPIIVHSRDATADTINILKKYKLKGIIHSFTEDLETAKQYINLGFLLGINGVLTFRNAKLKTVIKEIPLEYIVLETDCPYLTPHPFRDLKNEPKYILEIAEFISQLKGLKLQEIAAKTTSNLVEIFDI